MSRRRIPGRGRMPEQWEWTCDYCGKTVHTNSQATRPPGWVPRGRMSKDQHDFCSPEHEAEYRNAGAKPAEAEGAEAKPAEAAEAEGAQAGEAASAPAEASPEPS